MQNMSFLNAPMSVFSESEWTHHVEDLSLKKCQKRNE